MSSVFIAAKRFTVATRSSGVLAVVGAMSFGRPVPMDRPLISMGSTAPGCQPLTRFIVSIGRVLPSN